MPQQRISPADLPADAQRSEESGNAIGGKRANMLKKGASLVATRFLHLSFFFCLYQYTSLFNVFFISGCKIFFSTYAYLLFLYQLNVFCHGLFILTAGCKKYLTLLRILRFCITSLILPMFFLQELFATRP